MAKGSLTVDVKLSQWGYGDGEVLTGGVQTLDDPSDELLAAVGAAEAHGGVVTVDEDASDAGLVKKARASVMSDDDFTARQADIEKARAGFWAEHVNEGPHEGAVAFDEEGRAKADALTQEYSERLAK